MSRYLKFGGPNLGPGQCVFYVGPGPDETAHTRGETKADYGALVPVEAVHNPDHWVSGGWASYVDTGNDAAKKETDMGVGGSAGTSDPTN